MKRFLFSIAFYCIVNSLYGQHPFDNCQDSKIIVDPRNYCSGKTEFNLKGATPSGYTKPDCWVGSEIDMWFEFVARATGVNIVINGSNIGGTLTRPQAALYEGVCGGVLSQLECQADVNNRGGISLVENGLTVGQAYLIRIGGMNSSAGTFQLCINNFNPPVQPGQDCKTGAILCDTTAFVVQTLTGSGLETNEGVGTCLEPTPGVSTEDQSTWLKWTAANDGTLAFDIIPLKGNDDIDFALYELPKGLNSCPEKIPIRCNAASCDGPTGLNFTSSDLSEDAGCEPGEDLYVKAITMVKGKSYALLINNFDNTGIGFRIQFKGTGLFEGPRPDFEITPKSGLRCDQDFTVTDMSSSLTGTISSYSWSFGTQAVPPKATTKGQHKVNYKSFGQKFIVLTVESSNGCKVTKVKDIYADPCCDDLPKPKIIPTIKDASCFYKKDGELSVKGEGINPDFKFKINDSRFASITSFKNLEPGTYELGIIDIKGCIDSVNVVVGSPEEIKVDAGEGSEVELGDFTTISGTYSPKKSGDSIFWSPSKGVVKPNELETQVQPPGNTTYYLNVVDKNGCLFNDSVTIRTIVKYIYYAPNVIIEEGGVNGMFNIILAKSGKGIDLLEIYDRWGNKVYKGENLPLNDTSVGWDGTLNGKELNEGVYTWIAKIRYIDETVETKSGDVTLIKRK